MPTPNPDNQKIHPPKNGNDGSIAGSAGASSPPQISAIAHKQRIIKGHHGHPSYHTSLPSFPATPLSQIGGVYLEDVAFLPSNAMPPLPNA